MSSPSSYREPSRLRKLLQDKHGKSLGHKLRDSIQEVASALHPYVKVVIPNFRAAHYVYIFFMTFLGSIIVYPIANFKYIDILFLMSGAATQAGLNTINLNELRLSQQIFVYIFTTLSTPIFIHSSLLCIRLFWFERQFDNIKESSKLDHKMRKSATLAARTATKDSTKFNTATNQELGLQNPESPAKEVSSSSSPQSSNLEKQADLGPPRSENISPADQGDGQGIRFDNLPHPAKKRKEVDPSDMYKSIAMLQNKHERKSSFADDDVLVIKSPKEIERDQSTPIFTRKHSITFSPGGKKWKLGPSKKRKKWEKLKRTISNSSARGRRLKTPPKTNDDTVSIDSETLDRTKEQKNIAKLVELVKQGEVGEDLKDNDLDSEIDDAHNKLSEDLEGDDSFDDDEDDEDEDGEDEDEDDEDEDDEDEDEDDEGEHHPDDFDDDDDVLTDNSQAIVDTDDEDIDHDDMVDPKSTSVQASGIDRGDAVAAPQDRVTKFSEPEKVPRTRKARRRTAIRRWRTPLLRAASSGTLRGSKSHSNTNDNDSDEESLVGTDEEHGLTRQMSTNYLSWTPTVGRNSTFVHLTEEQKNELGGVEYRAVKLLLKILAAYYIGFHVMAFCMLVGYIKVDHAKAEEMRAFGFSPVWWGFFTAQSTFNDLGLTITPNSMSSFNESPFVLIVCSFFIVIGNTGFPILLRFIIWALFKVARPMTLFKESLGFLLDHPRRCFTLLFPSIPTWWLFVILVLLNAVDLILFVILDLGSEFLKSTPKGLRVLDGLFQAFSTRTAGFSCIDLSQVHPAVQVSYMIMMYISVLPLAISIRRTNVYEEQSLGIYVKAKEEADDPEATPRNFIGTHLRNQLSFDLWFIFLGLFIICIAEGGKLQSNDLRFSVFAILFEVISAYGTVGLSLGYPNVNQSLTYKFTTLSKLVIIGMMIRGRHRGLPYSLDRAIMLPDKHMRRRDQVQEHHAIQRATTLESVPTRDTIREEGVSGAVRGLTRVITRTAASYRRNSLWPAPTRLETEENELQGNSRERGA
ncbi:hypothetical protein CJJ07_005470 [Candidozyma auris]|nr:hypothetical protein CJJ07_005470 [[Candida] auris]QEL61032.1 hypothetical protein CJJ09_003168 [[Candida] auris]